MGAIIGAALAALVGGVMTHQTNQKNKGEAQKNRNFQDQMSSTAHQRQVADLRAAGLNPLLSNNSGASAPSGSQATMNDAGPTVAKGLGEAAELAFKGKSQKSDIALQGAQIKAAEAQAAASNTASQYNQAAAAKAKMETSVMSKDLPRAEIMNRGWNFIKDKMSDMDQAAAIRRPKPKYVDDYMQKFNERVRVNAPK